MRCQTRASGAGIRADSVMWGVVGMGAIFVVGPGKWGDGSGCWWEIVAET